MSTPTTPAAAKKTAAPRKPAGHTTTGAPAAGAATQRSLEQHLVTVAEAEVMDPQGVYEFTDSLRALLSGLAFHVHVAASQLEAAARKGARDSADGRLTLRQKVELAQVLRRMGRQLERDCAESLLTAAKTSVKAYALLQDFLENIESDNVSRPHRSSRGGFSLGGM